jgi:hypothetical protein
MERRRAAVIKQVTARGKSNIELDKPPQPPLATHFPIDLACNTVMIGLTTLMISRSRLQLEHCRMHGQFNKLARAMVERFAIEQKHNTAA